MSFDFSKLLSVAWGGWTTTWPTELLALIWLAFLASWVGASFWQGRTQKQVMTLELQRYRLPILVGGILYTPWVAQVLGWKPLWVLGNTGIYIAAVLWPPASPSPGGAGCISENSGPTPSPTRRTTALSTLAPTASCVTRSTRD